jgi:hypothetical protein
MLSAAIGPPNIFVGCSRERSRSLRLQESVTEHSIMGAHIRLVSSEAEERAGLDGEAIAVDEAPVGLPEEAGADQGRPAESRRDEMLGEAAPPLVAEPEDRAGGAGGRERPKGALARLIAFAGPRKARSAAAIMEVGSAEAEPESETALGKRGDEDTRADPIVVPATGATAPANGAEFDAGSAGPATAKPRRPLFARKGAIAVVVMTGVAAAATARTEARKAMG